MNRTLLIIVSVIVLAGLTAFVISQQQPTALLPEEQLPEDGTYRGIFADGPDIQVNVEFRVEDGIVREAGFRHQRRDENYNLEAEEEPYKSVVTQYKEALGHLEGREIEALEELYRPEEVVSTRVDGYTAATIRSSKIISAVRDGLNRGVYSY